VDLKNKITGVVTLFLSGSAYACPFCDTGGKEAAGFIIVFFGFLFVAALLLLTGAMKLGMFASNQETAQSILAAENIHTTPPGDPNA
jgi:ABC-type Na+ efflux pump permease subunit